MSFSPLPDQEDGSHAAPDDSRVAYHAGLPLRVPDVVSAAQRIGELLALNRCGTGARHGLLLHGVSGTGKTTALLEAAHRYTAQPPGIASEKPGSSAVPVVYVRLPPATSPRLLLAELARALGIPLRGSPTTADLAARVSEAMTTAHTGLVLVDEVQHLRSPGWSDTAVAEILDYLCDRIPATFAFAGIGSPESLATAVTHTPHRRLLSARLDLLPADEVWQEVISRFEDALRLHAHEPGTLTAQAPLLHQRTGGNVGRLALLLRTGAVRAIREGTEQLTVSLLSGLTVPSLW